MAWRGVRLALATVALVSLDCSGSDPDSTDGTGTSTGAQPGTYAVVFCNNQASVTQCANAAGRWGGTWQFAGATGAPNIMDLRINADCSLTGTLSSTSYTANVTGRLCTSTTIDLFISNATSQGRGSATLSSNEVNGNFQVTSSSGATSGTFIGTKSAS